MKADGRVSGAQGEDGDVRTPSPPHRKTLVPISDGRREWLIYNADYGQFWGPDSGGYFGLWGAGLYTEVKARSLAKNKDRRDQVHHISEYKDQIGNMRGAFERLSAALCPATERTSEPIHAETLPSERSTSDRPRDESSSCLNCARLTSALQTLTEERDRWIEREALAIPEDVNGFEEFIAMLRGERIAVEAHVSELTAALQDEKVWSDMLGKGTSPCGHWKAHAVLMDPKGAHIDCLDCQVERLTAALQQAHQQIDGFYRGNTRPDHPPCERFLRLAHAGTSDVCATCGHHEHQHGVPLQQAHQHDEEFVPHPFNVRIMCEEGEEIRDGIWCKDCDYHRDHEIHTSPKLQQAHQWQPGKDEVK